MHLQKNCRCFFGIILIGIKDCEGQKMNINNFERFIDKTILDRGYGYYIEGNILKCQEQGDNKYFVHIEGSDDYEVVVELGDNGEILDSRCDCPYDFGPVCKHEVAAYFQVFEMLNSEAENEEITSRPSKRFTIEEVLSNLSKEELLSIILNIAHHDTTLKNSLIVKYSNGDMQQELEACKRLIDSIVRKYTGREGLIKYRDTRDFVNEMEEILEKARSTESLPLSLEIAILLLEETIGAFQYADDSGGDIGSLIMETLEVIGEIAIECKEKGYQTEEIFQKLLAQADNDIFDGWEDYQIDLLNICFEFADDEMLREQLKIKIESMRDGKFGDQFMHYRNESVLQLLFRLIEQYGSEKEAEQFINEHLQFSSFRERLINKCIQENNYHKVLELAEEGERQDRQYPGLISRWKKFRYTAYKFLSLKEKQQSLAKELLFNGDFEYYQDLKELSKETPGDVYTSLKHELKNRNGWESNRMFLKLIEEENDLEEMLDYVRANPSYIESYAEKLVEPFKEEVNDIYKNYIKSTASTSSNRRDYQRVCHKITRFKKFAGKQKQIELKNELMKLYRKRPAFIDELGKIN